MQPSFSLAAGVVGLLVLGVLEFWGKPHILPDFAWTQNTLHLIPGGRLIFWFYTVLAYVFIKFFVYTLLFFMNEKVIALKVFVWVHLGIALEAALKVLFATSRPCFLNQAAHGSACACSFGSPSGHMLLATLFYSMMAFDVLIPKVRGAWKWLYGALCIFTLIMIGLSRVYFGVNDLPQVLSGLFWGLVLYGIASLFHDQVLAGFKAMLDMNPVTSTLRNNHIAIYVAAFVILNVIVAVRWFMLSRGYESHSPHPFAGSACGRACLSRQSYFADYSLKTIAGANAAAFLLLFWLFTKPNPTPFSYIFCHNQWNGAALVLKRSAVWFAVSLPFLIGVLAFLRFNGWLAYGIITACGLLFAALFHFLQLPLLKNLRANIEGDFFCNEHGPESKVFSKLEDTVSQIARF